MSLILADLPELSSGVSAYQIPMGPPSVSYPLAAQNNYARVFAQPYLAASGQDTTATPGATGIFAGTFVVGESDRQPLAGGFVTFERYFAELPAAYDDFQTYTYTFPALDPYRPQQRTETVVARVYSDFFLTTNPQSITISGAQRFINIYGWDTATLGFGTSTTPSIATYSGWVGAGTEIIPQDSTLERFIGPIWRRTTYYVKAR